MRSNLTPSATSSSADLRSSSRWLRGSRWLHAVVFALAAAVCCSSAPAHAQEIGTEGNFVFSVERLFGFYLDKQSIDTGPRDVNVTTTDFSLGWNNPPTGLTFPRLGFDYFLTDHLTLGGSFGVFTEHASAGGNNSGDATGISFAARVGYAIRITHAVSFWPRGGISYFTINADPGLRVQDSNLFALTLEGMFTLAPSENWAFMVGPAIDLGLTGQVANQDVNEFTFGILCGLTAWFGG